MATVNRLNTKRLIGSNINENMSAEEIKQKLSESNTDVDTTQYIAQLDTVIQAEEGLRTKLTNIRELKSQVANAKTALETANKIYSNGVKVTSNVMDLKPCVNGSPLATGAMATLTPLQTSIDTGTTMLHDLEAEVENQMEELITMQQSVSDLSQTTIENILTSLSADSNFDIDSDNVLNDF